MSQSAHASEHVDLFIVGGGPAGLSAGIYGARGGLKVALAEYSAPGGQIALSESIENYPGIKSTPGYELGQLLNDHVVESGCTVIYDEAYELRVDESRLFHITVGDRRFNAPAVVYAAGATPRRAGFAGEVEYTGRGVSYCATCDGMFYRGKDVYVVGGGTSACEEAEYLSRIAQKVTVVVRRHELRITPPLRALIQATPNIEILYDTVVERVEGGQRAIQAIALRNVLTNETRRVDYEAEGAFGVFVMVGHDPKVELVEDLVELTHNGIATDGLMRTRTPGLFAAGDVRDTVLRQVITAASDGAIAATSAIHYLDGRE